MNKNTLEFQKCFYNGQKKNYDFLVFPYAGGTAQHFTYLNKYIPSNYRVHFIELPGHGVRINEVFIEDFNTLISILFQELKKDIKKNIILFGHSLGAILAYEFSAKLKEELNVDVSLLVVSGFNPPHVFNELGLNIKSSDPRDILLSNLEKHCAMPNQEVINPEILDIWEPIFRADIKLLENYRRKEPFLINSPLFCISGLDDSLISKAKFKEWRNYTNKDTVLKYYPGDHFFIKDSAEEIIKAITYLAEERSLSK